MVVGAEAALTEEEEEEEEEAKKEVERRGDDGDGDDGHDDDADGARANRPSLLRAAKADATCLARVGPSLLLINAPA